MSRSQWIAVIGVFILAVACFMPWMHIEEAGLTISGIDTTGTRYGKPALVHFALSALILVCTFLPKIWAKRINLLFAALNLAWAIRNFGIIPKCEGGICPEKLSGLYLVLMASIIILVAALFPKESQHKAGR